jgi:C4-dicarboxylate-binding protein DctP
MQTDWEETQMKLLTTATIALALAVTAQAASASCDAGEMVIKFSHVTNTDKHPKGIAASLLQERVNTEMNGKACLEVFPNSTLYNDNKVLEAMLQGDVQLAAPSLSKFEKFTKQFRLFDLPFMFENIDAVDAFQASDAGQAMLDSMQRRGLQGLAYWHNGMKQMSASKPLVSPTDANGLKFLCNRLTYWWHKWKPSAVARRKWRFPKCMARFSRGWLMARKIHGQTSMVKSSSKCRTVLQKPITA